MQSFNLERYIYNKQRSKESSKDALNDAGHSPPSAR